MNNNLFSMSLNSIIQERKCLYDVNLKLKQCLMNVEQNFQTQGRTYENDVLWNDLKVMIPDFSYPNGFYRELEQFLFTNTHSFFDTPNLPSLLHQTFQQLPVTEKEDFLTVLDGAKVIIMDYQLPDMTAYNQLMRASKANRFLSMNVK